MKPFDLKAAKAGKPLVTREGQKATFVGVVDADIDYPLAVFIEGKAGIWHYTRDGRFEKSSIRIEDLCMAPTERTEWVVRFVGNNFSPCIYGPYSSEQAAKDDVTVLDGQTTFHRITIIE
jgi:hypothetical protein